MSPTEILSVMKLVKATWPNWRAPADPDAADAALQAWSALVGDLPLDAVVASILAYAAEGHEFPPPVGVIRKRVIEAAERSSGSMAPTVDQAWEEIRMCIRSHGMYRVPGQDFGFSHPAIADVVRSMGWQELCISENFDVVDRAHFQKLYPNAVARHAADPRPPEVAAILDTLAERFKLPELDGPVRRQEALPPSPPRPTTPTTYGPLRLV
jgi:hypothetical protein